MNFNQLQYWPGLVFAFVVFIFLVIILEKKFFKVVRTYWFFKRSFFSVISTFLLVLGMGGLILSLLDLRGPEEKVKMEVPEERTIILIDTSASMLAEDVKPSRLQKASLIAKHFARKAAGHQLAIVAFAEIQKKIVPFTNDIDLIDARLESIKNLRNQYGSSALSSAIQESIQYFREVGGEARGNILVLTDGEETAEGVKLNVPKDVHIALVGIGTEQGGRIPLDDGNGFRFGYKKDKGRDVITKLNENFFKTTASDLPSGKYWLANSYTLPSDEIIEFFSGEKVKGENQQDMIIRPVLMEWIVVPSIILLVLSYFFKAIRIFSLGFLMIYSPIRAEEKEEIKLSESTIERRGELQKGKLNHLEKVKLADQLYKEGSKEEALALYQENLNSKKIDKLIPPEAYLNYGTGLLEKGDAGSGLQIYDSLSKSLDHGEKSKKLNEMMSKNVSAFFKQIEQKEQQKKQDKKKDNKDQKDEKNKGGGGSQGDKKDEQKQSGQQKNDQQKPQDNKDQQDHKDQEDKKQGDDNKEDKAEEKGQSEIDKKEDKGNEGKEKKPSPPKKIPAKLKQLMSDDRQLQMKMIENGTRELNKRKSRESKDW